VRSRYRIFGSKPGAYGAGLKGLITKLDGRSRLSKCALTGAPIPLPTVAAPEALRSVYGRCKLYCNQDNREHDLLDSDDYYQFQGGLTAAVRALTGKNPQTYFGDHSNPENPRIRQLRERVCTVLVWSIPSGLLVMPMVTRVRLKWRLRLIIYLPTIQLGVEDHMYQESRRRTCSTHLCRRSFKKEPLGFEIWRSGC